MKIRPPTTHQSGSGTTVKTLRLVLMAFGCYLIGYFQGNSAQLFSAQDTSSSSSSSSSSLLCTDGHLPGKTNKPGWKAINVFYGNEKHLAINSMRPRERGKKWYSQVKQDQVVVAMLRGMKKGFFIDLAANSAFRLSNSYTLEQSYGWNGVCIEPNSKYWSELAHRKCYVAAAVVGKDRMAEIDYSFNKVGELGGIAGEGFDNKEGKESVTEKRYTVPLQEILENAGAPRVIEYFSLDVEGAEWFIMQSFPFDRYRIKIMTIERPKPELKELLAQHNYQRVALIHRFGETLWVHKDFASDLDMDAFNKLNVTKD